MTASIERRINEALRRTPWLRLAAKRAYQAAWWLFSRREESTPGLIRLTPAEGEHLFGYYDKSPWDLAGRHCLALKVPRADRPPGPGDAAEIRLISLGGDYPSRLLASTRAWNLQQGCMLQWLGPDSSHRVIFNDFTSDAYCAVILDIVSGERRVLARPVYAVSPDGIQALTLDFARLHRMRPGYGYGGIRDATEGQLCPDAPCLWRMDLATSEIVPILRYTDLAAFEPREEMAGAEHKVNHIMINPVGNRFMVLHRWRTGAKYRACYTRLLTADMDGRNLYNLLDDDMVSHCCWKDDTAILAYARQHGMGDRYFLLTDRTHQAQLMWDGLLMSDGHPSYSPDGRYVVTDTYPDRKRMARIFVIDTVTEEIREAAKVFAPFRYDNDTRCDLHPRWSRDGRQICFDAAFEGKRQSYIVTNPFPGGSPGSP